MMTNCIHTVGASVYVNTTLNAWHHHYFELNTTPTELRWMGHTTNGGERYRGTGRLDEVRMFSSVLTSDQITNLFNGGTGNTETLSSSSSSSSSQQDLSSQIFHEDFEDQVHIQDVTTADISM